ncbi:MAG: Signal peptidase-like protein, partial [Bacteroidota bacterium]|nr:Signal peptidase-like protein [Bacteroidota bacterium]
QCGRLKCCLNYELETYLDALKDIPTVSKPLQLQRGEAILQKTDIFKRVMWFGFKDDNNWYPVTVERVKEILDLNAQGIQADTLVADAVDPKKEAALAEQLEGSLERLDEKFDKPKKKKKKKKKNAESKGEKADQSANQAPVGVRSDAKTPEVVNDAAIPGQGPAPRPKNKFKNKKNKPRQVPVSAETESSVMAVSAGTSAEKVKPEGNSDGQHRNRHRRPHNKHKGPRPDKPASL